MTRVRAGKFPNRARPHRNIAVRGVVYATVAEAAAALGVKEVSVYAAIHNGKLDVLGLRQMGFAPMPVRVRGQVYPSARHAARALGLAVSTIHAALDQGREDRVGLPPVPVSRGKAVTIGGEAFPSMAAASRALGFHARYVGKAMREQSGRMQQALLAAVMRRAAARSAEKRAVRSRQMQAGACDEFQENEV